MEFKLLVFLCMYSLVTHVNCDNSNAGFYISNATHVLYHASTMAGSPPAVLFAQPHGRIVSLAVDIRSGHVFWSDVSHVFKGIYSADITGPGVIENVRKVIYQDVMEVNGLTIDWVSKHVYWTDAFKRTIEVCDYNGTNRLELTIGGLVSPRSVLADPLNGYLYWGDQGSRMIERSRLDGSDRQVVAQQDIFWPNQLDIVEQKLYWVDGWSKTINRVDIDGTTVEKVITLAKETDDNPLFGLTTRGRNAYVTVWNKGFVMEVNTGGNTNRQVFTGLGTDALFDIVYVDYVKQPVKSHICSTEKKAGCSHLCLPLEADQYRCACPTYGGVTMDKGLHTCRKPENILLYALAGEGQVGFIDLDGAPSSERTLVARSLRPVAVGYDPIEQRVYWSDVHERTVHRAKLDGTEHHIFLNHNHSLGVVDGLFVDWKHRNLYYSNMGQVVVEKVAFSWHKIEMISLDGSSRRTVVTQAEKPRAITVDVDAGYLYYTDWGKHAGITRCELDGSNPTVIKGDLENPNGLTTANGNLFVVDSHVKSGQNGSLHSSNSSGETWNNIENNHLEIPYGIAYYKSRLYVSDWQKRAVMSAKLEADGSLSDVTAVLGNVESPMGLLYSKRELKLDAADGVCNSNTRCDDICTITPSGARKCNCNSYTPEVLQHDNRTCSLPDSFILIADMNSIKLRSLADDDEVYTLVQGNSYFSNFASLLHDPSQQAVYFSDVNRKVIYSAEVHGKETRIFYSANDVIDGMVLDSTNQRLYWTEFYSGSIVSTSLIGQDKNYHVHLTNISKPRALQIDEGKGLLYWTEWGDSPKVGQLDYNTNSTLTLLSNLKEPNGLHLDLDRQKLYVGDGALRTVFECNLNTLPIGQQCQELTYMRNLPLHIYDIKVQEGWILYSDWLEHSIKAVSMTTGKQINLIQGLMRPTVFHIEQGHLVKECSPTSGCSDLCVNILEIQVCHCQPGRRLLEDSKTCINDTAWTPVEAFHCGACSDSNTCAQYLGTVDYRCQCVPGHTPDNSGHCIKCQPGTYKAEVGPSGCTACPAGSLAPTDGATSCLCQGGLVWEWKQKMCSGEKPGKCRISSLKWRDCQKRCRSDVECSGAMKCCPADNCGVQCDDPGLPDQCVYHGLVYSVGQFFSDDNCTRCQCRESSGGVRVVCLPVDCPPLTCQDSVLTPGQCCPHCAASLDSYLKIISCPKDVVSLTLASDQAFAKYNPTIEIMDNRRLNRDINVIKTPNMTNFWWTESRNQHYQKVKVIARSQAPDGSTDEDTCDMQVYVKDATMPQIICPNDMTVYALDRATSVMWPAATANDNVALQGPPILLGPVSKQFTLGIHQITYVAHDLANNQASCSFYIHVDRLDTMCLPPPVPYYGTLNCYNSSSKNKNTVCKLSCREGYSLNTYQGVQENYSCNENKWVPHFPKIFVNQACVKIQTQRWWLRGQFEVSSSNSGITKERDVEVGVREMFKTSYMHLLSTDPTLHVDISLQNTSRLPAAQKFAVLFSIEGPKNVTSPSYRQELQQLQQQMMRDADAGRLVMLGNGETLTTFTDSLKTVAPSLSCADNEQQISNMCLECPIGTYYEKGTRQCESCQRGYYQDSAGQLSCKLCPNGFLSNAGSFNMAQCWHENSVDIAPTSIPTAVIIGVTIGALMFVISIVAIIIVIIHIRRYLNDNKVQYVINTRDSNQMEFANQAYEAPPGNEDKNYSQTNNKNSHLEINVSNLPDLTNGKSVEIQSAVL